MKKLPSTAGISTIVSQLGESGNPHDAHITPIYQTSAFGAPNADDLIAAFTGDREAFFYSRTDNPNAKTTSQKIAYLEALDLIQTNPTKPPESMAAGLLFSSGMAAMSAAVLSCVKTGETIIAQRALYGGSHHFLSGIAANMGINTVWVDDLSQNGWKNAFSEYPNARVVYIETPINPTLALVDIAQVSQLAHEHEAWVIVDNTFASPYCQRPLTFGADIVIHSTTKYLAGHGVVIGGAVVSRHIDFMQEQIADFRNTLGASPSPFDAWLTQIGLKTFELRMIRHCENAMALANYITQHPKVSVVHYPGLPSHPNHELAKRQMNAYGGMLSFNLIGGIQAGKRLMDQVHIATLIPTLGNVDTLISHPATMSHQNMSPENRLKAGIEDGLVRLSVGIENNEDLIADLDQALALI